MRKLIAYIKDVVELVRNPPGEAVAACPITQGNIDALRALYPTFPLTPDTLGDWLVEFENHGYMTICPARAFTKHYRIVYKCDKNYNDTTEMWPIITIKSL